MCQASTWTATSTRHEAGERIRKSEPAHCFVHPHFRGLSICKEVYKRNASRRVSQLSAILLHQEQAGEIAKTQLPCVRMSPPRLKGNRGNPCQPQFIPPGKKQAAPYSGQLFQYVVLVSNSSKLSGLALASNHFLRGWPSMVPWDLNSRVRDSISG